MKRFLKIILCFVLLLEFSSISFAAKKKKQKHSVRSASSASGLVSKAKEKSKSSEKKKTSKKTKSSSKKDKKDDKSSKSKDDAKEGDQTEEISKTEQCMIDNLETLLNGECKFLNEPSILSSLSSKFYCVYNIKDKSKQDSVYNIYLYQNYGIKENSVKDGDSSVKIKNPLTGSLKGTAKYYEYILSALDDGSLKDGKILDFLTEEIIDKNDELLAGKTSIIESVSIQDTTIAMNLSKKSLESCKKETKKIVQNCGIATNTEMQTKIDSNCTEYDTALMKNAADKKTQVLDSSAKLAKILLNRADAVTDAKSKKIELEEKELNVSKKERELKNAKKEFEENEKADENTEAVDSSDTEVTSSSDNASSAGVEGSAKDSADKTDSEKSDNTEDKK